ncbi:MAG: ATP phosphoribosyltransferase regulatory subunit, partial [Erysipelotrichaceae bacterium]|nr:ATP phosphoribosyltransferase regulatory subunit [Erysipelotrichaceae bacterium]
MKQYNVPSGFKDLILGECQSRSELQQLILSVFKKWGYKEIVTPIVEYYDTYVKGFKDIREQEFYKLIDSSNRILALRADMTIPIVRVASTRFNSASLPLRFSYSASVYKSQKQLSGMMNEMTDCGVELIGMSAEESDLEILLTAIDTLKAINRPFTFEIGNINYFKEACNEMHLNEEVTNTLANLIGNKSVIDLDNYLATLDLKDLYKDFFKALIFMEGKDALLKAEEYAFSNELKQIVINLRK